MTSAKIETGCSPVPLDPPVGHGGFMETMESVVCSGADNALLGRLEKRARILGKYVAAHPMTVERVLAELDATGPSEAGDVIQSLLWEKVQADHLSACLSDQMRETPNALAQGPGGFSPGPAGATGYTAGNNGER